MIHNTAVIHKNAKLGKDVIVGPFCVLGENVVIGDGTKLISHIIIEGRSIIGKNNTIYSFTSIGMPGQDYHYKGEKSFVEIGDNNVIRESVTINLATGEGGKTVLGSNCMLMATAHLGHNSKIGDGVVLVNGVAIGGFVEVEDKAFISAYCPVHQFCKIGAVSMLGLSSPIEKDVPPYMLGAGNPFTIFGINKIGLERAGVPQEGIKSIKELHKIVFRSGLNTAQAIEKVKSSLPMNEWVKHFCEFTENSKRGIYKR